MMNTHFVSRLNVWILALALSLATREVPAQTANDTVFRIVVQQDAKEDDARAFKLHLESLGYVPVVLGDFKNGRATVYYGNFPSSRDAERAKKELARNGISAIQVIQMSRTMEADATRSALTILVGQSKDSAQIVKLKSDLEKSGVFDVKTRQVGDQFQVTAGSYSSQNQAQNALAGLKNRGYDASRVIEMAQAGTEAAIAAPAVPAQAESIGRIVRESGIQLNPQQMDEIVKLMMERADLKEKQKSTGESTLVDRIKDIESRMINMNKSIENVTKKVDEEIAKREQEARKTVQVAKLLQDADFAAKNKRYDDAIASAQEALKLDANNSVAPLRIKLWADLRDGKVIDESFVTSQYTSLRDQADEAEKINDVLTLSNARTLWQQIKALDKAHEQEANSKITALSARIEELRKAEAPPPPNKLPYILIASLLFLILLLAIWFLVRSHKHHNEMLAKIQEATAMRPMRGISGAQASDWMLQGPGGELPSPQGYNTNQMPPDMIGGQPAFHPNAPGVAQQAQPQAPRQPVPQPAPAPPLMNPSTGSFSNFDELFGEDSKPAPPKRPEARPSAPEPDDDFSNIFADKRPSAPPPKSAPSSAVNELDDILSGMSSPKAPAATATNSHPRPSPAKPAEDFGMDDIFGTQPEAQAKPTSRQAAVKMQQEENSDIPVLSFDDLLGETEPPSRPAQAPGRKPSDTNNGSETRTAAPARPAPDANMDPFASLGFGNETSIQHIPAGGSGFEFPDMVGGTMMASDETHVDFGAIPGTDGTIYTQNFEQDPVGRQPANWQGEHPYATLTVEAETPPEGSKNYMVYQKREGVGKVYYSTRFPNTSGIVSVEFDLRCNDKNKFLLGFYIEKDEDFQQSIHTKILRSESQTAPSIHIHGQPAPYMLGTWARIRYQIDLHEGKVDGYIDDRHVAKGISLPQIPKYLNTLAIRDNINTTGSLFIDNIVVRKIG